MESQDDVRTAKPNSNGYSDPYPEAVFGITLPPSSAPLVRNNAIVEIAEPQMNGYAPPALATDDLPPPQLHYAISASPSTRYSESPGPFSISSTPTSMSSYSPGIAIASKAGQRTRQPSPSLSRPPVTRRPTEEASALRSHRGLSAVRESSTSSSSASTVRAAEINISLQPRMPPPPQGRLPSKQPTSAPAEAKAPVDNARTSSFESGRTPQAQVPPQLAALGDNAQLTSPSKRPLRPSRVGTSELPSARQPSPIIQSNLSSLPTSYHRRQSSSESRSHGPPPAMSRLAMPGSKLPSRNPSPNPSIGSAFSPPTQPPTARGPTPDVHSDTEKKIAKGVTAPSPTTSTKSSRFGFFTRRTKTEPAPAQKPEKKLRKGPMAGTGHEGYGKYATRGRSGSTTSTGSFGRSASAGSTPGSGHRAPSTRKSSMTSQGDAELDEFFLDRLNPVVIRGEGSTESVARTGETVRSGSSQGSVRDRPSLDRGKPSLLPSAMSDQVRAVSPNRRIPIGSRRPSEGGSDGYILNLAARRSFRRSGYLERVPTPINTSAAASAPIVEASSYSIPETASTMPRTDDGRNDSKQSNKIKKKSQPKEKTSRKWNFFQRAQASPKKEVITETPATFPKALPSRSVAHYAMLDADDQIDMEDIEKLMQEPDGSPRDTYLGTYPAFRTSIEEQEQQQPAKKEYKQSMLLPAPPSFLAEFSQLRRPSSPKVTLLRSEPTVTAAPRRNSFPEPQAAETVTPPASQPSTAPIAIPSLPLTQPPSQPLPQEPTPSLPKSRPSRLAPIGRIPQVVHKQRDQVPQPPIQHFSRPFTGSVPKTAMQSTPNLLATSNGYVPFMGINMEQLTTEKIEADYFTSATMGSIPALAKTDMNINSGEFFSFPPRKDSDISYSSSSGVISFPPSTAIIPPLNSPPTEDEVWKEYDDLIDEVLSPLEGSQTNSGYFSPKNGTQGKNGLEATTQEATPIRVSVGRANAIHNDGPPSNTHPSPFHLRRSRLLAVLNPAGSPNTASMSDFLSESGRGLSVIDPTTGRLSFPSTARDSTTTTTTTSTRQSTRSSLPASFIPRQSKTPLEKTPPKNQYRDTRLMEMAETQSDGLVSMANLRFGALMTSKWLSFGRVLFSPAHFEIKDRASDRVLILDGLGKDWSYYVALTYPDADIYNLGPDAVGSGSASQGAFANTLPNHRHIHHQSLSHPFPFPRGFFAAVVFRFPTATSESTLRQCIFECKRVLGPGGHLELCVLDLDMCNMGNRARRAVRGLKVKMSVAQDGEDGAQGVCLKPTSDLVQRLVGRRGFENLNRCFVGVPVAGGMPTSGSCSDEEVQAMVDKANKGKGKASVRVQTPQEEKKFDFSSGNDEDVTRMVARVGRWWYSRCFESAVLPDGDMSQSIWNDEALIRECEKHGTTFRLLIAFAQKPVVNRRRTVSV